MNTYIQYPTLKQNTATDIMYNKNKWYERFIYLRKYKKIRNEDCRMTVAFGSL